MKSNTWRETTLGELADFINGDRGKNYPGVADRVDVGIPFINTGHILPSGRLTQDDMDFITSEKYNQLGSGKVRPGDIVYCLRGSTIGKTARNHYEEGAIASSLVIVRAKPEVNQDYLYYFLTSPAGQQLAKSNDNGSAQPNLSAKTLSKYPLLVPSVEEQESIVNTLNAIDNKIEVNTKLNQTLEQMAQAIFKSWFVDFDPVKAKMNGEQPEGMDDVTASLFPEKLVESELGLIPEGWDVGELTELAKLDTTSVKPNKEPETIWEHYSIPAFDDGYYPSFETGESIKSNKYKVKANAVLVSKLNPRFQRIWLPLPMDAEQAICSTEFMQFVPNFPALKPYLYSLVKSTPFQNELMNTVTGTTGSRQRAQPKQVAKAQVVVPPSQLMELYSEKVGAMFTMTQQNIRQNIELAKLRDTLLPKLLSGEIELGTSEELIEAI